MANSGSGESMIDRVMRVLEAFDARHSELTISAIARRADLPRATAYRLIAELAGHGVVDRLPDGKVRVGMRIWELSYRSLSVRRLREVALPYMNEVQRHIQQHTNLAIINDGEVLYVERLSSARAARNIAQIAGRLPTHACSSGLVLMAYAEQEQREAFLSQEHPAFTEHTLTSPVALRTELAEIRKRGACVSRGQIIDGSDGIAVPVFGAAQEIVAALNVVVPRGYRSVDAAITVLTSAAAKISQAMAAGMMAGRT
ncbi:IclR family transcriptional regulator [Microbacterium sp. NPDC096154]|uniref:IclR family transcriptional regulator n=1 Tax=Microbacterium sp. NPDC096154 TaxID=3155549 RepID=UPI003331C43C